jgi:hypothetical protein
MLLKQHVLLTCRWTHVNLICGSYEISYKLVCRKFMYLGYYLVFVYGLTYLLQGLR